MIVRRMLSFVVLFVIASFAGADELSTRSEIQRKAARLFSVEKFDELEALAERYRNTSERTSSGLWKLTIFYAGIDSNHPVDIQDDFYWKISKMKADNWVKQFPDSPTAHIVKGIILINYAWTFRGTGWARNVPEEAWKPFKENLAIAKAHMLAGRAFASRDPHWYLTTARILKGLGEAPDAYKAFVNEGLDQWPTYYQLYFEAINYLAPKWYGDRRQIEAFANQAVERTRAIEGMGMYARIYWFASQTQYDEKLFIKSNVVWEKMRAGIFDVLDKYPDAWNTQNFAYFSCLAKDRDTTRILFDRMTEPMIISAWKSGEVYTQCRSFAYSGRSDRKSPGI